MGCPQKKSWNQIKSEERSEGGDKGWMEGTGYNLEDEWRNGEQEAERGDEEEPQTDSSLKQEALNPSVYLLTRQYLILWNFINVDVKYWNYYLNSYEVGFCGKAMNNQVLTCCRTHFIFNSELTP